MIRGVVGAVRCVRGWASAASGASGASAVAAGVDTVVIIIIVIIITLATLGGRDSRPLLTHSLARSFAPCSIKQGLTAYNHNLDTSPEYYEKVTTTRKYEDRLDTIESVRQAGISVCAGGIIGLGEGHMDRYVVSAW